MTGTERIRELLRRAARDGRLPAGVPATPEAALGRIVEAVDAAVLARRLLIRLGGAELACALAARRLLSFEVPGPGDLPAGGAALFGRPLSAEDAGAVAALLRALAGRGGTVALDLAAPPSGPEPAFGGIGAAQLAAALGLAAAPAPANPLEAGLSALGDSVIGALLIEGDEVALLAGEPEDAALAEAAGAVLDRLLLPEFPLLPTLEAEGALTFAVPGGARHLLLAGHLGRYLLAAVEGADAAGTLTRWRAAALA